MANPKCKYCGKSLIRTEAFKVVVGGKNHYYCNEAEYNIIIEKENARKELFKNINDIFGYEVINTALFKEVNELLSNYSTELINSYLSDNIQYLSSVMTSKNFINEYGKIRYFTAILRNNLADYSIPEPEIPRIVEVDIPNLQRFSRKKKRRSILEIEEEADDL